MSYIERRENDIRERYEEELERLGSEVNELSGMVKDYEDDAVCVLQELLYIQGLIYQCKDYTEISQALDRVIHWHTPDEIAKAKSREV